MTGFDLALLALLVFIAAMLYSSVGHGGASGYLAAMAIMSVASADMKPAALCLNIMVAGIAWWQFTRRGAFNFNLFWPFIVFSIPAAFIGGAIRPDEAWYGPLIGAVLLFAAFRLWLNTDRSPHSDSLQSAALRWQRTVYALLIGGGIGFLSGLTGVGGGIFLSPVVLLLGWADARKTAAVSAAFIVVNSISGLSGQIFSAAVIPYELLAAIAPAAVVGGLIGTTWGSVRFNTRTLRRVLAVVLVIAGSKMILEALLN